MQRFRDVVADLQQRPFMVGAELVGTRGALHGPGAKKTVEWGEKLADWDLIDWVSITDNAGGHPQLEPSDLGQRVLDRDTDVIVHLTCKDRNRSGLESAAWHYANMGFGNILALTGDQPADDAYRGRAEPVFDIDSTVLIQMLSDLDHGLRVPGRKRGSVITLEKTDFFIGCAVSPFKSNEAELMCQYLKMELKLRNGAEFIIPQLGYDMRKSAELMAYLQQSGYDVPVFGNIYVLSKTVAKLFNKKRIPGCVVSDALLQKCLEAAEDKDKGRSFFRELAAKQYACFKALGYRGVYFGGFRKPEDIKAIVELAESYGEDDWKAFARDVVWPDGKDYYLYAEDEATGLAAPGRLSPEHAAATQAVKEHVDSAQITPMYRFNRLVHKLVFAPDAPFFKLARAVYNFLDRHPLLARLTHWQERVGKSALFNCKNCGDCSLADCYYTCPRSGCQKNQRNGPCGGSRGILCESEDVPCIWYKAYHRAKAAGELDAFLKGKLTVCNHELKETSGWSNYFLGRDHAGVGQDADTGEEAQIGRESCRERVCHRV